MKMLKTEKKTMKNNNNNEWYNNSIHKTKNV